MYFAYPYHKVYTYLYTIIYTYTDGIAISEIGVNDIQIGVQTALDFILNQGKQRKLTFTENKTTTTVLLVSIQMKIFQSK